ncbi:MAG: DUF1285 domain-containing protein [Gammaproteobacteria bacterium]|nr:DUF1285 domain-containing protein [Gammaproteobacteria bacterium]
MKEAFQRLRMQLEKTNLPPVDKWNPSNVGEIDIHIRSDGTWLHDKREIERISIAKLFSTVLVCEEGEYYLKTPVEKLRISVEDAPFVVVDYETRGRDKDQMVIVRTNFDECVYIDSNNRIFMASHFNNETKPYVHIRSGLNAVFARSVYYRLASEIVVECKNEFVLWSCGSRFVLGSV